MTNFRAYLLAFVLIALTVSESVAQVSVWQKRLDGEGESVGINPINPNTIYAQDGFGRLTVSRNQGKTWTPFAASVPGQIRQIIIHPKDTLTVFITDFFNGLWKSTNGGTSWNVVISNFGIDGESVAYDPTHPDTMYAGNFGDGTVYRSSDRGSNWTVMGALGTNLCSIAVRPDSSNILLVGSGSGRISKSTNSGVTWHQVKPTGTTEIPKIVINRTNPQIAYSSSFEGGASFLGVWKTTNGGESWFRTALQGINMWAIDIDQTDPNVLYAGTFDEANAGVYKTTDAGASWTFLNRGILPNYSFWNIHIDPINTVNVYSSLTVGSFGQNGVYRLSVSSEGIEGFVRDSLTNAVIASGSVTIQPANQTIDLSGSSGAYAYYRFASDTATSQTFSVTINSTLMKQQTIGIISDSILEIDLLVSPGSIRGNVFNDANHDGIRDNGETGVPNWTIQLSGQSTGSVLSDVNGDYAFTDLLPGSYTVSEQSRNGWAQTAPLSSTYSVTISLAQKDYTGKDFGNKQRHAVLSVTPAAYSAVAARTTTIQATFDTAMTTTSFNDTSSWIVAGKFSGRHRGTITFNGAHTIATFTPLQPFQQGEPVLVDFTGGLNAADAFGITPFNYQFTVAAKTAPGTFVGRTNLQVGTFPWGVAVGDIDGDGDNDIVTANSNSSNVSVLRNTGGGSFGLKTDYTTGASPIAVVLVDVDHDGDLDIITSNNGNSNVSVLKNNGDGTFAPRVDYSVTFAPFSLEVADMNGDGYPDIVTGGSGSGSISVLLNNGTGGFPTHMNFNVNNSPWASVLGDLDGDGTIDVASAGGASPSTILAFGNLGDGTLGAPFTYTLGANSRSALIADITGDNLPDLIATNSGSSSVSILPKNGATFGPKADITVGSLPWGVASGDLNGDGLADLVVTNVTSKTISVLTNVGGGSFGRTDYPAGSSPRFLVLADLDGDGDLDVVTTCSGTDSISIYINSGAATISTITGWNLMSLPVDPTDHRKSSIYPSATTAAFIYTGSYSVRDTLEFGTGFWIKFAAPANTLLRGNALTLDTADIRSGWNMIGALSSPVNAAAATTIPPSILVSNFYDYSGSYHIADSLLPGRGYWVKANQAGKMVIASSGIEPLARVGGANRFASDQNSLVVRDAAGMEQTLYFMSDAEVTTLQRFELPPSSPDESFDARFASGRILESAAMSSSGSYPVELSNAKYPVTLSWTLRDTRRSWRVKAGSMSQTLKGDGTLTMHSPGAIVLEAAPGNSQDLPRTFALDQNYPNPFNPATTIRYQLAAESKVSLKVYNVLGQEVASLVDEVQAAGYKSMEFSSTGELPSGLYTYRLVAGSFTEVKKMLLVK